MPTFLDTYIAWKRDPKNAGKTEDQLAGEYAKVFQEQTGRSLADFDINAEVPDFRALAEEEAAAKTEAEIQRREQQGLGEYIYETASKGARVVPRVAGTAIGIAGAAIDPESYRAGGDIDRARDDYFKLLDEGSKKDFLDNFQRNLGDLRESTFHILATASGYSPNEKGRGNLETGSNLGKELFTGAIGGTIGMLQRPLDTLTTRTPDALLLLLSLRGRAGRGDPAAVRALRAVEEDAGKTGKGSGANLIRMVSGIELPAIPGFRKPLKRAGVEIGAAEAAELITSRDRGRAGLADSLVEDGPKKPFAAAPEGDPLTVGDLASSVAAGAAMGIPFGLAEPMFAAPLARYLWGTAEATPAGARNLAKVRRFLADPYAQSILADEQQVRQLMQEPARFRAMITREGDSLARVAKEPRDGVSAGISAPEPKRMRQQLADGPLSKADGLQSAISAADNVPVATGRSISAIADRYRHYLDENEQAVYRPSERLQQQLDAEFAGRELPRNKRRELAQMRKEDVTSTPVEIPVPSMTGHSLKAMNNIRSHMDEVGIGERSFPVFQTTVYDALNNGSSLLMSEQLRNRMVEFIVDRNGLTGKAALDATAALQKNLVERFEKRRHTYMATRDPKLGPQVIKQDLGQLRLPNGEHIKLADALEGTMSTLNDTERAGVQSSVIRRIVAQAADEAARTAFEVALKNETGRNASPAMRAMIDRGGGVIAAKEYASSIANETIINGAAINQALPRGMIPLEVAEGIRGSLPQLVKNAESRVNRALTELEHAELRQRIDDMANRVERYEPFTDDTKSFMPDEPMSPYTKVEQNALGLDPETKSRIKNSTYVSPDFNATVWWNTLNARWSGSVFDSVNNFTSLVKGNLTVHNPSTHVGNYLSNVGVQTIRLAVSPMRMIFDATNESRKYLKYKDGEALSPMDARTFKALDHTKIFSSDMVHAELGVMKRVSATSAYGKFKKFGNMLAEPGVKAWKHYDRAMKEGYKWGDQTFKIHEASRIFRELAEAVDTLENGDYIRIQTSPAAHTTIHKSGGKIYRGKKVLTPEALDRSLSAAAVRRSLDLFVDYTQVPGLLLMLRQLGPLSIASPFVTWFWRVMDFPGKKGLIYRTLMDDPIYTTNNASLTKSTLTRSLQLQARRMLQINGMRETLHDERETMRQLIKFQGQSYGTGLFYEAANPGYFTYMRMANTDFFAPGMTSIRVISAVMANLMMMDEYDDLTQQQQRLVQRYARGEVATMKDVFTMAAVSGGPIIEQMHQAITGRNRFGGRPVEGEWVKSFMPVIFGQLPWKAVDTTLQGLGIWDEKTLLSQRFYSQSPRDPNEREDYGPWAFRTLTGLGWRDAGARDRSKWFIRRVQREMKHSLTGALKKKVKQLRRIGRHDEAEVLMEDYHEMLERIRTDVHLAREEADDLINALEHEEHLRVNPDMDTGLSLPEVPAE